MAKKKMNSDRYERGAEKRDVVINSYMGLDRLPKTLGNTGPVYRVNMNDMSSQGQLWKAYDDNNQR